MTKFLLLAALFLLFTRPASALMEIEEITHARARELGLTLRTNAAGPADLRVWLEFKAAGELKGLERVELELADAAGHVLSASLKEDRPGADVVAVSFLVARDSLPQCTLMIVTSTSPRSRVGHRLKVHELLKPGKPRP